jgi:PAS domain-containing protein
MCTRNLVNRNLARVAAGLCIFSVLAPSLVNAQSDSVPDSLRLFLDHNCVECHQGSAPEGGLDLTQLSFDLEHAETTAHWTKIHDRVQAGEMPPPEGGIPRPVVPVGWSVRPMKEPDVSQLDAPRRFLRGLAQELVRADQHRRQTTGRSEVRRLNREEYENTLRQVLDAPWLLIADRLPEDAVEHLFPKSGRRLDVSHVQLTTYMAVAEQALRSAVAAAAHQSQTSKLYARAEDTLQRYLHYRTGQTAATRSIVPLDGWSSEVDVIRKLAPVTVGESDPEKREREAMGVFSGTYSATTKYDFTSLNAPSDGRYRLRFKTFTFMAGNHGASGGPDEGLTGGNRNWWRPDRNLTFVGYRTEPITLYALTDSGESRWLTTFDSRPEPSIFECEVDLRRGEGIRPDATRLVRTRPGWNGNPNATAEGIPGFAMNWLEVTGPLQSQWPPASYQAVFDQLPFEVDEAGQIVVLPGNAPRAAAQHLLARFLHRAVGRYHTLDEHSVAAYLKIFDNAIELGFNFTDAMITCCATILCSPEFLYLEEQPGPLPATHLDRRLAYFLWNGPADPATPSTESMATRVERMLDDPRRERFVHQFLDYWLNLRDLLNNSPDAILYPDYYLDDWLAESSLLETRLFFNELIEGDLPARNLIDSDFTFVNERLASLYDLPIKEGVRLWRAELPPDSKRGGLITQAGILRVTANGTTTSPVIRGAWVMERLLGLEIPPPPSGVAAVEPDIRGATTILQQLELHRQNESCNACHARFDPAGVGLENFDVCGGWRQLYRATGTGEDVFGFGKNGHQFTFKAALPVEANGRWVDGRSFEDIVQLKQLLLTDERQVARNLLHRLIVFATGTPVTFADRAEVEDILDRAADHEYGVRTLIHELVASQLFQSK